jgi:asparagine synthase (glutamine-hydrolysing)
MRQPFAHQHAERDHFVGRRPHRTNLQRRLVDDTTHTNLPMLLRYEDRISMAFSLEARVPLLDYRVVEFAFRQPATFKLHDGWSKWAMRAAMEGRLPELVRLRRDKLGFPTPQTRWLAEQRPWLAELFGSPNLRSREFIDGAAVVRHLPAILESPLVSRELWRWLCLELWMQRFDLRAA